ncbi:MULTISPECIES: hypothetical protein [Staphylococcus]|uniref:hypothetical protein n=1 Tax=Staphylococcus TaxID=1279 RepID=UPI000D029371|nr:MULTISPECIES: hypothetical protein [Staphylococcus]MDT0694199.1 hypothetical protein [Staphylococcus chromogenes]HDK8139771.1 hypothetical protein [Staphylococcus aureus]
MATNLDKFLTIEKMMQEAEEHMEVYLSALEKRYEYMNDYRREYSNLSHTLGRIVQSIKSSSESEENHEMFIIAKGARIKIDEHIDRLEELRQNDPYTDYNKAIERLRAAKSRLNGRLLKSNVEEARSLLNANDINVEEVDALLEYTPQHQDVEADNKLIKTLENVRSVYVSSFVVYRKSCEENDDVFNAVDGAIDELLEAGYREEADLLTDAMPDIENERGKRPDPEPLLNLLQPIKSAGLEYFQSGNKNSHSYDLCTSFSKELAYVRRALLEDREYIGTRNAFNRLLAAYEQLSQYMYERFHQLGGVPYNYHGHDSRN